MLQIPRVLPVYLASEMQKRSNAPVPGQKLVTKVSRSRAIPPSVPVVSPPGWPLISALRKNCRGEVIRVRMGIFTTALRNKNRGQILIKKNLTLLHSALLVI